jgi:hypothetical protein
MIRRLVRFSWLFPLGLALASLPAGCGDPNEGDFKAGGPDREGVANPKYATDTPETYRQFHKDSMEAAKQKAKKGAAAPAPAATAPTSKPDAEPAKKEEPEKKP